MRTSQQRFFLGLFCGESYSFFFDRIGFIVDCRIVENYGVVLHWVM